MRLKTTPDKLFLAQIPDAPGVYRYFDVDDCLLYVGKAINLKKRVKSYFQRKHDLSPRISLMVSKIISIEITVTENEVSALLLESNLIKTLKPKYNIIFRDDKSYPYIKISNHQYPLIEYYRNKSINSQTEQFYGPYPNTLAVKETLELLQKLFRLRTCSDSEFANRSRPCMLYQIERCCAPCVNKISSIEYANYVNYAKKFLSGDYVDLINKLSEQMYVCAGEMEFEKAGVFRDQISLIRDMQNRQIISDSNVPIDADMLITHIGETSIYVYLIIIRKGLYVGDKQFTLSRIDSVVNILEGFIESYYETNVGSKLFIKDIITKEFILYAKTHMKLNISNSYDERFKNLFEMGDINLKKIVENKQITNIYDIAVIKLKKYLKLELITRIECYDTSHNHGSNAVASMVVYANGKIDNSEYRKFNLTNDVGGDDLLALEIVLRRRLNGVTNKVPDVILIDGGMLQYNLAKKLIEELGFYGKISTIAIYKGDNRSPKLDRVMVDSQRILSYDEEPELFRLLQTLRDEAHRFAITGHRKKQINKMTQSKLDEIPGVGNQKRKALMAFFGSVKHIANASVDELQKVDGIGHQLANEIYSFFNS